MSRRGVWFLRFWVSPVLLVVLCLVAMWWSYPFRLSPFPSWTVWMRTRDGEWIKARDNIDPWFCPYQSNRAVTVYLCARSTDPPPQPVQGPPRPPRKVFIEIAHSEEQPPTLEQQVEQLLMREDHLSPEEREQLQRGLGELAERRWQEQRRLEKEKEQKEPDDRSLLLLYCEAFRDGRWVPIPCWPRP